MKIRLMTFVMVCTFFAGLSIQLSLAQLPFGKAKTLERLPDDQIEGTIWEYKGTLKKKPKAGEKVPVLEGRFRIEERAVFAVSKGIKLPGTKEVEKVVDSLKSGKGLELKAPGGGHPKRIGQFHQTRGGKWRLDFDDKESLNGPMVLRRKKKTADVWMGTYSQKKGRKVIRQWDVIVRPIED